MASTAEQVVASLEARQSFIVEAGAGSGKTSALVEALTFLLSTRAQDLHAGGQQIVCITYTNVAANEILSRINHDPLVTVSTIHEFLWSIISRFQRELRQAILAANDATEGSKHIDNLDLTGVEIEYWQYPRKWDRGKIHHDDVISLSDWMFTNYPKLSRLVTDRYPIIFVDEYQDTHEPIVRLLLDVLHKGDPERITIGFFGDHMQKIYSHGVGKVEHPSLHIILKHENYRCSLAVIDVLNRLRPSLEQKPGAKNAPGSARIFFVADGLEEPVSKLRAQLRDEGWTEANEKVLMLTRRGIASDLRWPDLLAAYNQRGGLAVDDFMRQDDEFGEQFAEVEAIADAYAEGYYGEFLARISGSRPIHSHADKNNVAKEMLELDKLRKSGSIGEVLDFIWKRALLRKPTRVTRLEERIKLADDPERAAKDQAFLDSLRSVPYEQVAQFERYLNGETPFSTNHGIKGEEYENVLVVLDDTMWTMYKFEAVLAEDTSKNQYERSLNLFYVSCSRAKHNLVVLVTSPMGSSAVEGAKKLFGVQSVLELD